ncbi:MAG: YhfC family glutamic-type intramembrane protease [Saccharofermentanales bacterium]
MVSTVSIVFMCVTLSLCFLLPIVVLLLMMKGRKGVFGVWIAGALGFIIPQMVIRIPVLQALGAMPTFQLFTKEHPYIYVFTLALTAGLFETAGRMVVLKVALGRKLSYMTGLAAGAGHGGIEAMALVGLVYVNNLVVSLFINAGSLSTIIPDAALAESIRKSIVDTTPNLFLIAGFERIFTMMFHILLSVALTLFIMKNRAVMGFFIILFIHFAMDFSAGVLQIQGVSSYIIEGVLLAIAIISLVIIFKIRPLFGENRPIPIDPGELAVKEGY